MHKRISSRMVFVLLIAVLTTTGCGKEDPPATRNTGVRSASPSSSSQNTGSASQGEIGASGEGWGNLSLTFVYDGVRPNQPTIDVTKDVEFCGKSPLLNESLIVNPENLGIANVVVMLNVKRGDDPPPIHPSFDEMADAVIELNNQGCAFSPHVAVLRVGQTLLLRNTDDVGHNVKGDPFSSQAFNPIIAAHSEIAIDTLNQSERIPVLISCNIHPWMSSRLVVKDHPYVGVSDENGKVVIENLPTGTFQFVVWHEKCGYVSSSTQEETEVSWPRGKAEFTIVADDENDQGTFSLAPSVFE